MSLQLSSGLSLALQNALITPEGSDWSVTPNMTANFTPQDGLLTRVVSSPSRAVPFRGSVRTLGHPEGSLHGTQEWIRLSLGFSSAL